MAKKIVNSEFNSISIFVSIAIRIKFRSDYRRNEVYAKSAHLRVESLLGSGYGGALRGK